MPKRGANTYGGGEQSKENQQVRAQPRALKVIPRAIYLRALTSLLCSAVAYNSRRPRRPGDPAVCDISGTVILAISSSGLRLHWRQLLCFTDSLTMRLVTLQHLSHWS